MELDTLYIKSIKSDGQHNYIAEIDPEAREQTNTHYSFEMLERVGKAFDDFARSDTGKVVSLVFFAFLLGFVVYKVCQGLALFEPEGKKRAKDMANDTIYGHAWDAELQTLMAKGDFSEAVVLCYLHLIETLNNRRVITFMVSKTPQMFLDEAKAYTPPPGVPTIGESVYPMLQTLTNHYLQIRYGHRKATEELAKEMIEQDAKLASLSNQI